MTGLRRSFIDQRGLGAIAAIVLAVGLGARLVLATGTSLSQLSSDEAHTGIQAMEVWRGRLWAFVPGNSYGGNIEAWVDAPFALLLGASPLRLKMLYVFLWLVAACTLAAAMPTPIAAVVTFTSVWAPGLTLVLHSTLAYPGYGAGMVAAATCLWTGAKILVSNRDVRRCEAAILGSSAAVAIWMHPFFLVTVAPVLLAVGWRALRPGASGFTALLVGGGLGAAPPIIANIRNGFRSLHPIPSPPGVTYGDRLAGIMTGLVPRGFGQRWIDNARACDGGPWSCDDFVGRATHGLDERWTFGGVGPALMVLLLTLLVGSVLWTLRHGTMFGRVCSAGLAVAPIVMASLGASAYTRDGRYFEMLLPLVAVVVGEAGGAAAKNSSTRLAIGVAAWTSIVLLGPAIVHLPLRLVDPDADLRPVVAVLESRHVRYARAEYWIAYRLSYTTREHVIASPLSAVKFARYEVAVRAAEARGTAALVLQRYQTIPAEHPPQRVDVGQYILFLPSDVR